MTLRDIVFTTIWHRAGMRPEGVYQLLKSSASDIASRIEAVAPEFDSMQERIEWLSAQIEREEFSACEDVLDGSLA